jgi:hypothetical protein
MKREIKSLIIDASGKARLNCANNAARKRAKGKCVTSHCQNFLPVSAIQNSNKHCSKCMMRVWRVNSSLKAVLAKLRERAAKRRVPCTLTPEELLLVIGDTHYLDLKGRVRGLLHLDRIVPALGYVAGNVRVIPMSLNVAKGNVERHEKPEVNLDWLDEF